MDLRKIKKLIELVEESGISELEVKSGDEAVRIARPAPGAAAAVIPASTAVPAATAEALAAPEPLGPVQHIRAPMAGTFYAASNPAAAPFARVGQPVSAGDVICIIESMKMMNEIKADCDGTITEILVENTEPVASGQGLFVIRAN